ncbi:hypothetical protein VTN77DRAFT_8493 [Rasamsonia byssochlamydoides]|uniref:uncharacterized protein n=1 Tax=Rasamsonia byssochlamydoides TaxID=89139 RepID=UPI00374287FC
MDRQKSPLRPPSGIPRLASRIPLPTGTGQRSLKPSPSRERLQADPGVDIARLRRPSQETLSRKSSTQSLSSQTARPVYPRRDSSQPPQNRDESLELREDTDGEAWELEDDHHGDYTAAPSADSRPSLSDRTIETLSRIPPSPSPRGRRSPFFPPERSPMGPPPRPASALNSYSRSPSRSSHSQNGVDEGVVPPSTVRRTASRISMISLSSGVSSGSQKTASDTSENLVKSTTSSGRQTLKRQSMIAAIPSTKRNETLPVRSGLTKTPKPRPLSNAFVKPSPDEVSESPRPLSISKSRKPSSNVSSNLTSPSSTVSKTSSVTSSVTSTSSDGHSQEHAGAEEVRKVSKSSSALRESIAKAKAARKAARQSSAATEAFDPWGNIDAKDPFNQLPKDANRGLLRKRVEAARTSGSLNIAAMGLKEIPDEVMTMYDFDPDSNAEWYASVDLVKFIAADNEIETLPDAAFPDIDPQDFDPDEDSKGNQFGGLEVLDLHGNLLRSLPVGLRRLHRLSSLNLSNNQLSMDDIEVVTEIPSLSDLKLANNNLQGTLLSTMGRLSHLEVLDLRGNRLSSLPDSFSDLTSLKVLNLSENQFRSLPFETLSRLPLIEINAAGNKLQGSLMPSSVHRFETLQTLDVARNALERLSENDTFDFPNLKILAVDANRLKSLPCMSSWRSLLRLSAEDNSIAALPDGFLELDNLKYVDLTANDLSRLDERIGLMENLATFRIANNPLRERKFLNMDTEDLKRDLRNRCAPALEEAKRGSSGSDEAEGVERDGEEEEEEGSVETEFTLAPESPSHLNHWKVKPGGVLDRSSTDMLELNVDEIKPLISSHDIKCLYIQRNKLQSFPVPALSLIANTLTDLDLSHNPLNSDALFSASVSLPHLQSLNLSTTGLTSLDLLQENLSAPSLKFLDVSNNRLTGPLPFVRRTYSNLITFLAADNKISSLEFESVQGLQVLDVSNNNIDFLPPKLGLLAADASSPNSAGLRRFEVAGNSFRVPRWQIVAKGTEAILEWLKGRIPADELRECGVVDDANEVD